MTAPKRVEQEGEMSKEAKMDTKEAIVRLENLLGEAHSKRKVLYTGEIASTRTREGIEQENHADRTALAVLAEMAEENERFKVAIPYGWKARAEKSESRVKELEAEIEQLRK